MQAKALDQQIAKEGTESLGVLAGIPIAVKVSPAHQIADSNWGKWPIGCICKSCVLCRTTFAPTACQQLQGQRFCKVSTKYYHKFVSTNTLDTNHTNTMVAVVQF